jgi:hypothetical protein
MTPASATLKTLIQCRSLWLWHFFGLAICLPPILVPLFRAEYREGALLGLLIVPLWSGIMSASVAKDFFIRPFSFGVPRHQQVWRTTLLWIGLAIAGVCSIVFLLIQSGNTATSVLRAWQMLWLSLLAYSGGILAIVSVANAAFIPSVITIMLLFSFNNNFGAQVRDPFQSLALEHPVVTTLLCAVLLAGVWRRLGSRALVRKQCGEPFMPLHDIWSGDKQAAFNTERNARSLRKSTGAVMKSAERFFLARMRTTSGRFTQRALWGTLYILTGKTAPAAAWHFVAGALGLAALTVALGFYHLERFPPGVSAANFAVFLVMAITAEYRINPHASLMLNISRKNRFWSLMLAGIARMVASLIVCLFVIMVSRAVGLVSDEFTFLGRDWTYAPVIPKAVLLFTPMLPFFYICQILFPRHAVFPVLVITILSVTIFATNAQALLGLPLTGLALLQVVSWLPFVALVRHHCYFWDLKLNGQ